ncbi:MAG: kelch repeat-containing protein [Bacteroidota bacterium]
MRLLPLYLLVMLVAAACERPFVPPIEPAITIVEPSDPDVLRFRPFVEVRVKASSFRNISRVEIDGIPAEFDSLNGNWQTVVTLSPGVNELQVTAFDIEESAGTRTLRMAYIDPRYVDDAPALPAPWRLGGHTATLLNDGSVLVTGGAPGEFQEAVARAFLLPPEGTEFELLPATMSTPRYGHTATLLPDGRVLIIGGSTSGAILRVDEIVDTAEIYDPATREFTEVTFEGAPLQRAEHATFVSRSPTSLLIDIFGGLGEDPVSGSNSLSTLASIQSYRFENNTLTTFTSFSDSQLLPAYGMASTLVSDPATEGDGMGRYVITGASFLESGPRNTNFSIDFAQAPIRVTILNDFLTSRIQHASAALEPGIVAIFGGFQGVRQSATSSAEIFIETSNRFSTLDSQISTRRRFSHTATKLSGERILILGGFSASGQAISESLYFEWGL